MSRPRHQRKELEAVLAEAERKGWRVEKGKKYYTMLCPPECAGKHRRTVHLTPSDPGYERHLRSWLIRETCWETGPWHERSQRP